MISKVGFFPGQKNNQLIAFAQSGVIGGHLIEDVMAAVSNDPNSKLRMLSDHVTRELEKITNLENEKLPEIELKLEALGQEVSLMFVSLGVLFAYVNRLEALEQIGDEDFASFKQAYDRLFKKVFVIHASTIPNSAELARLSTNLQTQMDDPAEPFTVDNLVAAMRSSIENAPRGA